MSRERPLSEREAHTSRRPAYIARKILKAFILVRPNGVAATNVKATVMLSEA